MKSKTKVGNKHIIFILALLMMAFFVFGQGQFSVLTNYEVLSLSGKVSFVSNDPTLNKEAFLMTIVQNGKGMYAKGTIAAKDIVSGDKVASNDILIQSKIENYRCLYSIASTDDFIYRYELIESCGKLDLTCVWGFTDSCIDKGPDYFIDSTTAQYHCFQRTVDAVRGIIKDPAFDFKTTFDITVGDLNEQLVLTPSQTSSISSDSSVNIGWTGNLVSGTDCPDADNEDIGIVRYQSRWKTVEKSALDYYRLSAKNEFDNCIDNAGSQTDIQACVLNINARAAEALNSKLLVFDGSQSFTADNPALYGKTGDGVLVLPLSSLLQFPMYTLIIDAESLDIVIPVSQPKIISQTKDIKFSTGGQGYIDSVVKNDGAISGSFAANIVCESPLSSSTLAKYLSLEPGESEVVTFKVLGESNTDVCKKCVVTVYDRNNPNNKDDWTTTSCVTPLKICQVEGQTRCIGDRQEKCEDGDWREVVGSDECKEPVPQPSQTCSFDSQCDDDNIFTVDKCEGTKIAGIDTGINKKCTNTDMTIWYLLAFVIAIIFMIIIVMMIISGSRVKTKAK